MDSFHGAVNCNKARVTMRCRGDKCAMVHTLVVRERCQTKDVGIQRGKAMTENWLACMVLAVAIVNVYSEDVRM